jgi:hypothetical protein
MTVVAGCSGVDVLGSGDDRAFDSDRLAEVGARELPTPPDAFPVAVPDAMVERHRDRARALLDRVPEEPDVPNGSVVRKLRRDREDVVESLDGDGHDEDDPLERLEEARHVRESAATVEAAYRAATADVSRDAVAGRREEVRQELLEFRATWTYRGGDAATAVVFHRALEDLARDVRRGIEPRHAFPDDPLNDVFAVGEIVGGIEDARAALDDADRLRVRYLDDLTDPSRYRTAIATAVRRLENLLRARDRDLTDSLDPAEPPFDRSIENTPAERLYVEAVQSVRGSHDDVRAARRRGDRAEAFFEAGYGLASIDALEAIVAAIEDGRVEEPTDAEEVATEKEAAVDALETAWASTPAVLSVELARPAHNLLRRGTRDITGHRFEDDHEPTTRDADRAYVNFYSATRAAEAVPATVDVLARSLDEVAE